MLPVAPICRKSIPGAVTNPVVGVLVQSLWPRRPYVTGAVLETFSIEPSKLMSGPADPGIKVVRPVTRDIGVAPGGRGTGIGVPSQCNVAGVPTNVGAYQLVVE